MLWLDEQGRMGSQDENGKNVSVVQPVPERPGLLSNTALQRASLLRCTIGLFAAQGRWSKQEGGNARVQKMEAVGVMWTEN